MSHNHDHSSSSSTLNLTGNVYVDGILWGGKRLPSNTITYSFWRNSSLDNDGFDIDTEKTTWSDAEKRAARNALATWSNVANINFVQDDDDTSEANFGLLLVNNKEIGVGALGQFGPPGEFGEGIGYFNYQGIGWGEAGLKQGGLGFVTLIHEFGHGLGLAHPHDEGGGSPRYPGVREPDDLGRNKLNQGIYTTMSYNDGLVTDANDRRTFGYQGTPTAFDIAAIQYLYGANTRYKTGNDTYRLPTQNKSGTFYACIWDAGGTDTLSARGARDSAVINLNQAPLVGRNAGGYLSAVDGIYGGFTIANGVTIENAIGGSGDDVIVGNDADNRLKGGAGDDELYGNQGQDHLLGMGGSDILNGGWGDDKLVGGGDRDDLSGGKGDDRLYGNSGDDVLTGGRGKDKMWGNRGSDTFLLQKNRGADVIYDFNIRQDFLGLQGIQLGSLDIIQRDDETLIELKGDRLVTLVGVEASDVNTSLFTVV